MALFQEESPGQAYLKMGIYGAAGSGKTFTATKTAMGLAKYIFERTGKLPPILFIDTETGASWMKPMVTAEGIKFLSAGTRAFTDLLTAVKEAEALNAILIVDSITHFWVELCQSFAKQRKRRDGRLEFQDYAVVKPMWAQFTQAFLVSNAHIILCGRAGNTYEYQDTEQSDGRTKKELITTGTKMKAESEMGYEPSLLIEMFAEKLPDKKIKKIVNKCFVWKDRSDKLNGREYKAPDFQTFAPHIQFLNIGGEHVNISENDSSYLFDDSGRPDWQKTKLHKEIVQEEIQNLLVKFYPSASAVDKQAKLALIQKHFAATWKEIEEVLTLEKLRYGFNALHVELEKKPSRYFPAEELNDEIPDYNKAPVAAVSGMPTPASNENNPGAAAKQPSDDDLDAKDAAQQQSMEMPAFLPGGETKPTVAA